jgi:hypothetical protein
MVIDSKINFEAMVIRVTNGEPRRNHDLDHDRDILADGCLLRMCGVPTIGFTLSLWQGLLPAFVLCRYDMASPPPQSDASDTTTSAVRYGSCTLHTSQPEIAS